MKKKEMRIFSPEIPPDLEHATMIREEALDWLETNYPGSRSFATGDVLRMADEPNRRWLIARLRARDIGNEAEFSLPDTADALTALFLRSRGVKFLDAVKSVAGGQGLVRSTEPRYGGVWNRLIISALEGLRRRVPARLLASVVFSLLHNAEDQVNCLVIVKRRGKSLKARASVRGGSMTHDDVYRVVLERPAPSCAVVAPSREVMFFSRDQLPARSEITSRSFTALNITTEIDTYELLLGTLKPASIVADKKTIDFASRVLDIVYPHFESFVQGQSSSRLETPVEPGQTSASDLQLWLTTQLLTAIYPGAMCEISETSRTSQVARMLASSAAKPWEPSPWQPAKGLEMLSGYASRSGVPLVVDEVERPLTMVIEGIESELRYLRSKAGENTAPGYSALALPIPSSSGPSIGSLYMLMPRPVRGRLQTEVLVLTIFSRIIGETIERYRAAAYSADVATNAVSTAVLTPEQFKAALLDLLNRKAEQLRRNEVLGRDVRLPFLLVSAHGAESNGIDPETVGRLKKWLVETLHYVEWRSFIRGHWAGMSDNAGLEGFIGEVPGIGIMIALGNLVSKDELDHIRGAFPMAFNRTSPTNSPVKLVAWALDVPAQRILDAAQDKRLPGLAAEIDSWALNVATLVDDLAQSSVLARDQGEWDAALKKIRQALQKRGARNNSYLRRLAVDCSLALADWPGALKYAQEAVALSEKELGSGFIRSLCMEADAHLCLCNPVRSWDLYSRAGAVDPTHPLPRYYRGQALLLMARLLRVYEDECRRNREWDAGQEKRTQSVLNTLVNGAMEDLTAAADLLDKWGLVPESYQNRNFHLVPTLLGQGLSYLLARSPGPAASRLQSARRAFPKDDLFFREFLFAKCWEQGVHRQYAALLLGDGWVSLRDKLRKVFGKPS